MAGGITIQSQVLDELTPTLRALADAAADMTAPMDEISELLLDETEDHFRRETGPDGVPWQKSQRVLLEGGKTLFEHGDLYNALDRDSGPDFAQAGVLAAGGQVAYAAIHNFGGTIENAFGRGFTVRMPKREYLGLRPTTPDAIGAILTAHLVRATAASAASSGGAHA